MTTTANRSLHIEVTATRIIGTNLVMYQAWETDTDEAWGAVKTHQTIQRLSDGRWYGLVGTQRNDALDALPAGSEERIRAAREWQAHETQRAHAAILAAYPHLRGREGNDAVITVKED